MSEFARALLDAFKGGLLAVVLMRAVFTLDASPIPDVATGRTEQAGILPLLLQRGFYMTPQQVGLLDLMAQVVLTLGMIWVMTALLARAQARIRG